MIARNIDRVTDHTSACSKERILHDMEASVVYHALRPEKIDERLNALDREWDIERALETGSSVLSLTGLTLGLTGNRKWLILPVAVQSFFLLHALQGWCPPLPLFRKLGVRTQGEIEKERYTLKAIRGDFRDITGENGTSETDRASRALHAARSL